MRSLSIVQLPIIVGSLFLFFIFALIPGMVLGKGGPGEECRPAGAPSPQCDAGLVCTGNTCLIELIAPADGAADVLTDAYFQWYQVSGAAKYILDVSQFTQSEDNIPPGKCSGSICSFGFLDLTAGVIQYLSSYTWGVTAINAAGNPIVSSGSRTFTTESAPVAPPPPGGGDGGVEDFGDLNPIPGTKTLTDLFNNIFNFLFGLSIFIVPVIVIYAAFLMLMGGGDPVKLAKGRMILLWTAIAFILILVSKGLPAVFRNLL